MADWWTNYYPIMGSPPGPGTALPGGGEIPREQENARCLATENKIISGPPYFWLGAEAE